jgi:Tfp pilus assembly protein PilN
MIYESQNIRALNEQLMRKNQEIQNLTADNAARAAEVLKVKDIEVQAKELEDKLKILKLLSKLRLREVKTLDFMQSSIPEKVWLKDITYESDKIHVEAGHFQFAGAAVATEELTEFVRRLEDSAYLTDVIVVRNQEVSVNKSTNLREFLFTAEVENKN